MTRHAAVVVLLLAGCARAAEPSAEAAPPLPGHAPTCPADCPACNRLFRASLDAYCAAVARRPTQAPMPVNMTWAALQTSSAGVLGLVLLGEGTTPARGPHAPVFRKLSAYVQSTCQAYVRQPTYHRTWPLSFGLLMMAEQHRAVPSAALKARMQEAAAVLQTGLVPEKGWRHGLEKPPKGYGPFIATTIWAAAALADASEQGVRLNDETLAACRRTLQQSLDAKHGGASYFAKQRTAKSVGRTSGVLWALNRWFGVSAPRLDPSVRFVLDRVEYAPHGHASGMMNFGWAALAAANFGDDFHHRFWQVHRATLFSARDPSGGFTVQEWQDFGFSGANLKPHKPPANTTWPDPMYGNGWATAWMLLAWQAGRGKSVLVRTPALAETTPPPDVPPLPWTDP